MGNESGNQRHRAGDGPQAARASRRNLLRGAVGAAGFSLLAGSTARASNGQINDQGPETTAIPAPPSSAPAAMGPISVFPNPGARTASPATELSFRGLAASSLGPIKPIGSQSGTRAGIVVPHADGRGASFLPDEPFWPGERVTVETDLDVAGGAGGAFSFMIVTPARVLATPGSRDITHPNHVQRFHSRPDLRPPVITVTTPPHGIAPGSIFTGARLPDGADGPLIVDDHGELIWFEPMPIDVASIGDVRVQQYRGKPVLTWWEGVSADGHGRGHYVLRDTSYREIVSLPVGNGYPGGDGHEFRLSPWNTALFTVFNPVRWDLSSVGGSKEGVAVDGIVQELEIPSGRVLFEWHSLDHVALDESVYQATSDPNTIFDYFHVNAIAVDRDGNLIVSSRHTCAIYKIDHTSGEVIWQLSGKHSDFTMGPGTKTYFQHNAEVQPNGELTVFDNGSSGATPPPEPRSRGIVVQLDLEQMTATLVRQYVHPGGEISVSQGNMQVLPNGNVFIGWGSLPNFSEFRADGTMIFDGTFPSGDYSYRSYRFPWIGHPAEVPALAMERGYGQMRTVYASWNGATEVAIWQVLAGPIKDRLQVIAAAPRTGFETAITVQTAAPYLAVRANDGTGRVLATSAAIET